MIRRKSLNIVGVSIIGLLLGVFIGVNFIARAQAIDIVTVTPEERKVETETPADYGMIDYQDLTVTTEDGIKVSFWYVPGTSDAAIVMVHGIGGFKGALLDEMALFHEAGYHVAALDTRAHGRTSGELLSFGYYEANDIGAVYDYVSALPTVNPDRTGLYGESMGGSGVLHYGMLNENVRAVAANSPFGSLEGTVDTSVEYFTHLPSFPFGDLIQFWAEQQYQGDMHAADVSPIEWAQGISPRPVFVTVAGDDNVVAIDEWFETDPSSFGPNFSMWYLEEAKHASFSSTYFDEYSIRLLDFFAENLN